MIHFVSVILKEIFEQGKDYPWRRPSACLRCNHYRVWGHGFVERFFHGFATCLYLKCYRCPACGCVMTVRPDTHFSRVRCCKVIIRSCLARRLCEGRWPRSSLSPPRMRHWLANLSRQTKARLTDAWQKGLLAAFDHLAALGFVPVGRAI